MEVIGGIFYVKKIKIDKSTNELFVTPMLISIIHISK